MEKFFKGIDSQIKSNQGKNIFFSDKDSDLQFIDNTIKNIAEIDEIDPLSEKLLIDYTTDKVVEEFCRVNQYFAFNSQSINDLRNIYRNLFHSLKNKKESLEIIARNHYQNLQLWLEKWNPFAKQIYSNAKLNIEPVVCNEYSSNLQLNILKIDVTNLQEPVLDIGCGKTGNLVNYLCSLGIDACGIDRFSFSSSNLISSDWLEYNYGVEKWGTIISNLAFSNHFNHHHLRVDGNYIEYGKKYMDILKSLKTDGKFHYSPHLPFIEKYLPESQFKVHRYNLGEYDFQTVVIIRLS